MARSKRKGDSRGLQRRRRTLAQKLSGCSRLIRGSLVVNRRRCGRANCRCAEGDLHESLAFTYKEGSKSVLVHVPREKEKEAREAHGDYERLKSIARELSEVNVALLRQGMPKRRAPAKRRTTRAQKPPAGGRGRSKAQGKSSRKKRRRR